MASIRRGKLRNEIPVFGGGNIAVVTTGSSANMMKRNDIKVNRLQHQRKY
jgi:hypothetical protein